MKVLVKTKRMHQKNRFHKRKEKLDLIQAEELSVTMTT